MPAGRIRFRWLIGSAAVLAAVSIGWFQFGDHQPRSEPAAPGAGSETMPAESADHLPVPAKPAPEPPPITIVPAATELSAALLRKDDPAGALDAVGQLLYFYRQGLGENPVGQNEDIVAAMLGENSKRAAYLPADSPAIKNGKLVDPWGTPYWFHPVSRDRMEIRSAGPDRELFTADDLQN